MQALLVSTGLVAIAEIGDKTMLLAIVLAARWRKPWPIIAGIFVATLLNHALASTVGVIVAQYLQGPWMRWVIGLAFLGFAAWALVPDQFEDDEAPKAITGGSVFLATAIAFFLVEMGDKTQVATVALAAQFGSVALVAAGTTLGMLIANVPAVFLGEAMAKRMPLRYVRWAAAALFAATGAWILIAG